MSEDSLNAKIRDLERELERANGRIRHLEKQLGISAETQLPNKTACIAWITQRLEVSRYKRKHPFACMTVVFVDLNGMKTMNESLGHFAVDDLIVAFAHFLKENIHEDDVAGHIHGDEFLLLLPMTDEVAARAAISRIDDELRKRTFTVMSDLTGEQISVELRAKYGAVTWHRGVQANAKEILRRASAAQRRAKNSQVLRPELPAIVVSVYEPYASDTVTTP